METSTGLFIVILAVGFIFLRWLITPIPHAVPPEVEELRNQSARPGSSTENQPSSSSDSSGTDSGNGRTTRSRRSNREITDSMVEVVQAIAPQLTAGQIRHDLQRTGSVEVTINRYMERGSLPFPPGEQPPTATNAVRQPESSHNIPPSTVSLNLLEKYGLHEHQDESQLKEESSSSAWGTSKQERSSNLQKKRQEMILNARKRLASQLQNDISNQL